MGILTTYLAIWDTIWTILFSVLVSAINYVQFHESTQFDVINSFYGAPMPISNLTGEYQVTAYLFLTIMVHFMVLVALQQKPYHYR